MKTDANGNPLTRARIRSYRDTFKKYPGNLLRSVTDEGEGVVCHAVYQRLNCGCRVVGNGSLPFPFTVQLCARHKRRPRVKIEVLGGVAEVTRCTPGVTVTIQDHDNEKNG